MQMRYGLAGCNTVVDANVVALWPVFFVQHQFGTVEQNK